MSSPAAVERGTALRRRAESAGAHSLVRMRSTDRREQIVVAATRLVGEYGVRGTTMSRVAEAVGLTPMALYRHFPSKAALLREAAARLVAKTMDWLHCSSHPSVVRRLHEIGEAHARLLSADVLGYGAPMMQFVTLTPAETDLYHLGGTAEEQVGQFLSELIAEGKRQGTVRPDVDPVVFARQWIAWAEGEDIGFMVGVRSGTFSREPFLRMLHLLLADIAAPGEFEIPPPSAYQA